MNVRKSLACTIVAALLLTPSNRPAQADGGTVTVIVIGVLWGIGELLRVSRRSRHFAWWEDAFGVVTSDGRVRTGLSGDEARRKQRAFGGLLAGPGRGLASATNTAVHRWLFGPEMHLADGENVSRAQANALSKCRRESFLARCRLYDWGATKQGQPPPA